MTRVRRSGYRAEPRPRWSGHWPACQSDSRCALGCTMDDDRSHDRPPASLAGRNL